MLGCHSVASPAKKKKSTEEAAAEEVEEEEAKAATAEEVVEAAAEATDSPAKDDEDKKRPAEGEGDEEKKKAKKEGTPAPAMNMPPFPMYPGFFNPYMAYPPGAFGFPPMQPPGPKKEGDEEAKDGEKKDGEEKEEEEKQPQQQPMMPWGRPGQFPPMMMPMMMMPPGMMPPPPPQRRGISLALQCDVEQLSDYQILVRQQLELFEAGTEDVESNTQGRKKPVTLGQVGLRCRHCAGLPLRARGRGAVYYPAKLTGIYQAAQNMAASHLCQACQQIPPALKQEIRKLRERRDNASGGKQYWADGCRAQSVVEDETGLRFSRSPST